jgi:hypothetical protein
LKFRPLLPLLAALALGASPARAISIVFDYSFDTNGFFTTHPTAKTDLDAAAQFFNTNLTDSLSAITPGGSNTWSVDFFDPATGSGSASVTDLALSTGQIRIYVGGGDLGAGTLGVGGPGGYSASGSTGFLDTLSTRGQAGVNSNTDFAPWGGSISFSSTASWYFDSAPSTNESFAGLNDFYSVALHETGHVLGIGTADSWFANVSGATFTGAASMAAFGGLVPLEADGGHWASDTMSTIYGTSTAQEAAMDPDLTTGTRKVFTTLDMAGLQDVGWTLAAVPEPETTSLLLGGFTLFLAVGSRRALRRGR